MVAVQVRLRPPPFEHLRAVMPPPFPASEYDQRQLLLRAALAERGLDVVVVGDPSNINWLTGFSPGGRSTLVWAR